MLCMLSFSVTLSSQRFTEVEDVNIINNHKSFLKQSYPNAFQSMNVLNVYSVGDDLSRVDYLYQGVEHQALLNSGKKEMLLVATYEQLPISETPGIILEAKKDSEYSKWTIERTYKVKEPSIGIYYALDLVSEDGEFKRVHYSHLGHMRKAPY